MYYVIQVASGMESKVEEQIAVMVEKELYGHCFHPVRQVKKKIRGEWKELHEKLLPGYVFITSEDIRELYQRLRDIPAFARMLGKEEGQFIPLAEHEAEWLEQLTGWRGAFQEKSKEQTDRQSWEQPQEQFGRQSREQLGERDMEVPISEVSVSEDDVVTILSGPLKNMEGCIKKIDLHRRIAKVEVDFMHRKTVIHLGIEIVGKNE